MPEIVKIQVNGQPLEVPHGTVLAAALARAGLLRLRSSVKGQLRGVLCGMGICFECRVTIGGKPNCRSCQTPCEEGMEVSTDG